MSSQMTRAITTTFLSTTMVSSWQLLLGVLCADAFPRIPTESGCVDDHSSCTAFAAKGECAKNPSWMLSNCRKSCGTCKASAGNTGDASLGRAVDDPRPRPVVAPRLAPSAVGHVPAHLPSAGAVPMSNSYGQQKFAAPATVARWPMTSNHGQKLVAPAPVTSRGGARIARMVPRRVATAPAPVHAPRR